MNIITSMEKTGPLVLALGTFDGVHRGHQRLILEGKRLAAEKGARLRVCTFDRHPLEVLRPEAAPGLLTVGKEQAERMMACGVDELQILPFTRETAETEPEAFLKKLRGMCDLQAVVAGWNYSFGRRGRGNAAMLEKDGKTAGYTVHIVPPVRTEAGEIISSSAIREKLLQGKAEEARDMLGIPYAICGQVVNGKHEGSRIGFPTANIQTDGRKQLPVFGVYVCTLRSGGRSWPAVVNIGLQPTIPSGQVTVEAHALHMEMNLYGQEARVELLHHLRGEIHFQNVEALIHQIQADQRATEQWFAHHP